MKVLLFVAAIIALANAAVVNPHYKNQKWIPKMPRLPVLIDSPVQPFDPYIVGGTVESPAHSWPYEVALYIDNLYFCAGTLISDTWVMTAAHCTTGAKNIRVVLGEHNINVQESTQVEIHSKTIITNPNYHANTIVNDIGLVELQSAVKTVAGVIEVAKLPLQSAADLPGGTSVVAIGWGLTSDASGADLSPQLRQVDLQTISNTQCAQTYGSASIDAGKICTSGAGGHGTCSGDSGGSLNHKVGNSYEVRGIVSFGAAAGCAKGDPDAFTRVSHYRNWVDGEIRA